MNSRIAERVDFLILGAGVAGLRAALTLTEHGSVLVVTKEACRESNTHYAQGGIAVAMGGERDVALHLEDTLMAGDDLVYRPAAEVLVREGPERIEELMRWGARFDSHDGVLMRTREGAHSLPRILHANGDATGAEIGRALEVAIRNSSRIKLAEWVVSCALVMAEGRVVGADLVDADNCVHRVLAYGTLLATGGAGQIYSETTNPSVATGDGIALALSAGAVLADMEFYQFHPTALNLPGAPRFLLSEALRGEGAHLVNEAGERFMERYHPMLELAPRDVVARAIVREAFASGPEQEQAVYLDMRSVRSIHPTERFPGISRFLAAYGLSLEKDRIPIHPAAHYLMGGVRTDISGRTSVPGLFAAGEVAATGVHGANRLASNSLLEGLVFGARAAEAMVAEASPGAVATFLEAEIATTPRPSFANATKTSSPETLIETLIVDLRSMMWRSAGLLRDEQSLTTGLQTLDEIAERLSSIPAYHAFSRRSVEAHSMVSVARAVLVSALARRESRGAHFRNDFPEKLASYRQMHTIYHPDQAVTFEPLDA